MKIIKLSDSNYKELVNDAARIILNGGVVAAPFDTVYGFIADPKNEQALKKLFSIKKRPLNKTIGLAVSDIDELKRIASVNDAICSYVQERIPGKYTFILSVEDQSLSKLCTKDGNVGIRIPDSDLIRDIAAKSGGSIAQTSANKSGQENTFSISDFLAQYASDELSEIDLILDGGKIDSRSASEIVDLTDKSPRRIERN